MNERIKRMIREVERRGGKVGFCETAPDAVVEEFLEQVLACPDCQASSGTAVSIDDVLARTAMPKKFSRH